MFSDSARVSGWPALTIRPGTACIPGSGRARIRFVAEMTELADQRGEALSVNELHRVVMDPALAANSMHRDDPLMLHMGCRKRLGFESLEAARVDGRGERQDLERDPPPQRDLFGLVDDAHPPAAHLAQKAKVADFADVPMGVVRLCVRGRRGSRASPKLIRARTGAVSRATSS